MSDYPVTTLEMVNKRKGHNKFVLDMTYVELLRSEDRPAFEKRLFPLLGYLGFTVIAGSRRGVSVAAPRETIESTFQAKILITSEAAEGGTFGLETVTRASFSKLPVIPEALAPYVNKIQFSPPVIPLT